MKTPITSGNFPRLLQSFFVQRLIGQREASTHTVASYRDAFRLLVSYLAARTKRPPSKLVLGDLDAPAVIGFLDHLETKRGNSVRSRNARLAAVRSFLHYASFEEPTQLPVIQRALAVPFKRFDRPQLGFLSREEMTAVIDAPNRATWSGRRDRVLFQVMYNTGARVSEIGRLRVEDLLLESQPSVHIFGKGRKERRVPLWKTTARSLRAWLSTATSTPDAPVFPNRRGGPISRAGIEQRLRMAVNSASSSLPRLKQRRVSPHTIRHTTAMHLLQSGVDISVIAMWLGHSELATTHQYVTADMPMKERALNRLNPPFHASRRFRAKDALLEFLEGL